MRIVLIGQAGSGKDTVGEYLVENYGCRSYAFATALKRMAEDLFPLEYHTCRREVLQKLGAAWRSVKGDFWVDMLFVNIPPDLENIVITDCRYKNEYDYCLKEGFIPVKVNCDDNIRRRRIFDRDGVHITAHEMSHESEQLNVPCEYHLNNNFAVESLYVQVDEMIDKIREGG